MRSKAELELFLDGEKLATARKNLEDQLIYVKHLAHIYSDDLKKKTKKEDYEHNKFKKHLKTIEPLYVTFNNQALESLDTIRSIVTSVANELGHTRTYANTIGRRGSMSSRRSQSSLT